MILECRVVFSCYFLYEFPRLGCRERWLDRFLGACAGRSDKFCLGGFWSISRIWISQFWMTYIGLSLDATGGWRVWKFFWRECVCALYGGNGSGVTKLREIEKFWQIFGSNFWVWTRRICQVQPLPLKRPFIKRINLQYIGEDGSDCCISTIDVESNASSKGLRPIVSWKSYQGRSNHVL